HVSFAAAGDAVTQPMLFGDNFAIKLMLIALLLGQYSVAPFFEMSKAALNSPGLPAVEPDRAARECRQETPIMADQDQCGAPGIEVALQPLDCRQVEMI